MKLQARSILVVEDDRDVREALVQVLQDEGYSVVGATDGRTALEHLLSMQPPPGLVLLDLLMPDMDGWQFRAQQQSLPGLSSIPVVIFSADGKLQEMAASLGADGYLQKPVGIDSLLDVAERFCRAPF